MIVCIYASIISVIICSIFRERGGTRGFEPHENMAHTCMYNCIHMWIYIYIYLFICTYLLFQVGRPTYPTPNGYVWGCIVRPHQHKATTTISSSTTARVLFLKNFICLRLDSKSNAFIGGHCDTIPHSARIRRFLRSPRQLPQVALHESLVLNLSSCDYAATASPWRYSILLDRHFLTFFPQQQNAMGSLHNIDFGVFWASWGGWCLTVSGISGFDGVPKVPGPRAAEDMWDQVLAILGLAFE